MAYLSNSEYVLRYGNVETVRITDESKSNTIDQNKVTKAISDASEFADSYLGTRYELPIADPPDILQGIVAALARELLFKGNVPPVVTENADRARSQLKDLSRGLAVLPVAPGDDAPIETATGAAVTSGDGRPRIFSRWRTAGYTHPGGGLCDPCGIPGTGPCN